MVTNRGYWIKTQHGIIYQNYSKKEGFHLKEKKKVYLKNYAHGEGRYAEAGPDSYCCSLIDDPVVMFY